MTNQFLSLLKVNILSFFGKSTNKNKKRKNGINAQLLTICGASVLIMAVVYFYFDILFSQTSAFGTQVLSYASTISTFLVLIYFIYSSSAHLFACKDYDLLLSFPIKKSKIVGVKVFTIYLIALAFTFIILFPSLLLHIKYSAVALGVGFYLKFIVSLLIMPLIPLAISIMVSTLIAYISSKLPRKNIFEIVISFALTLVVILVTFLSDDGFIAVLGNNFIANAYANFYTSTSTFFIVVGVSLASMGLILTLIFVFFDKINNSIKKVAKTKTKKIKKFKGGSQLKALIKKEYKTLFAYPIYAVNVLMSIPMAIFVAVILIVIMSQLNILAIFGEVGKIYIPIAIASLLTICPTTVASISLEGGAINLLKSLPISSQKVFTAKILANLIIFVPIGVIMNIVIGAICSIKVLDVALMCIVCSSVLVATTIISLLINVLKPKLDWKTPQTVVKQSMAVMLSMLADFAMSALTIVIVHFVVRASFILAMVLAILFTTLISLIGLYYLLKDDNKLQKIK